jgi:hypothetical protein
MAPSLLRPSVNQADAFGVGACRMKQWTCKVYVENEML